MHCGYEWVDPEWTKSLKKALGSLSQMYEDTENRSINHYLWLQEEMDNLAKEKKKEETKYTTLIANMKNWIAGTEGSVISTIHQKIMEGSEVDDCHNLSTKKDSDEMAEERNKLKNNFEEKKLMWTKERACLMEENKNLKDKIRQGLSNLDNNKGMLKRIRSMCYEYIVMI